MTFSLRKWFIAQYYRPGVVGFLCNPYYIVRTCIYRAIQRNAGFITGDALDFGCGSKPYRHLFKTNRYVGLDVHQSGHDHEHEPVDVYYDGNIIPFQNNSFDSCFSSQVFEHVFQLTHSLHEIFRIVKHGGRCLFLVPFVWEEHEVPYDFGRYSSFGLEFLIKQTGFEIIKRETDSHYFQVLAQLWCAYIHDISKTKYSYINVLVNILFVFPFVLCNTLLQYIMPRSRKLYFNNVIVVRKP